MPTRCGLHSEHTTCQQYRQWWRRRVIPKDWEHTAHWRLFVGLESEGAMSCWQGDPDSRLSLVVAGELSGGVEVNNSLSLLLLPLDVEAKDERGGEGEFELASSVRRAGGSAAASGSGPRASICTFPAIPRQLSTIKYRN
eukprot:Hpha_TRINITY_DN8998_c0_g1::TRINITY_DN8998_c0_g1_i1::g.80963::m.80963